MEIAKRASATKALWSVNLSWEGLSRFQSMGRSCGLFWAVPGGAQTPLECTCQPQPLSGAHRPRGLQGVPGGEHVQLLPHARPHPQAAGSHLLPPVLRNGARPQKRQETQPSLPGRQCGGLPSCRGQSLLEQAEPSLHGLAGRETTQTTLLPQEKQYS